MITLITGAPGTGKSNAVVSMMENLGKDRQVFVFGIPDLKIPHEVIQDPSTWPDTIPDGSCVVLDEVQNVWRPRGPGQKVPEHVSKLETHRHRGLDFYVITQGPNLVDGNVRALVGRHVHLRDLGILGRWWYEWPECADNCRTAWKNAPIKKRYKLDKTAQAKYKSASIHIKPVRSIPWMLAVMVLALVTTAFMAYRAYVMIQGRMHPAPLVVPGQPGTKTTGAPGQAQPGTTAAASPGPKIIDDRIDWIPRISSRPETAPAYDHLRQVVAMPRIVGGMLMGKRARCVTQQGTDAGISEDDCRKWLANPPFDPYAPLKPDVAVKQASEAKNSSQAHPEAAGGVFIQDGTVRTSTAGQKKI